MVGRPRIHEDRAAKQGAYRARVGAITREGKRAASAVREAVALRASRIVIFAEAFDGADSMTDAEVLAILAAGIEQFNARKRAV